MKFGRALAIATFANTALVTYLIAVIETKEYIGKGGLFDT